MLTMACVIVGTVTFGKCLVHTKCEDQAQTQLVELMNAIMHQEAQQSSSGLDAGEQSPLFVLWLSAEQHGLSTLSS